jgi:WD40 repeat protein
MSTFLGELENTANFPSFLKETKEKDTDAMDETNKRIIQEFAVRDSHDEVFCLQFDPLDQFIAYGCEDGQIRLLNLENKEIKYLLGSPKIIKDHQMPITTLKWKPGEFNPPTNRQLLSCASDGEIFCWQPHTGELLYRLKEEEENEIFCMDYSPTDNQFATAGLDHRIRIYDDETQKIVLKFLGSLDDQLGHSNRIFALKYSPENPNILISGGWDNTVFIWDLRKTNPIGHILGPNCSGESLDIYGDYIIAGSYNNDKNLQLMRMQDYSVKNIKWYDTEAYKDTSLSPPCVYAAKFSQPNANYIIAGGTSRNEVRIFKNIDNFSEIKGIGSIASLKSACVTIDCAHTFEPRFAVGCSNGTVRCFRLEDKE